MSFFDISVDQVPSSPDFAILADPAEGLAHVERSFKLFHGLILADKDDLYNFSSF